MKRAFVIAIALVLVLVAAVAYYLYTSLDAIVKTAIERYGSELTGTPVHVESVNLALPKGEATIRGLRVANPPGFSKHDVFALQEISVALDPMTVRQMPIQIRQITIGDPRVHYELDAKGVANVNVIRANLARSRGHPAASSESQASREIRLRVATLTLDGGGIAADTSALGGAEFDLPLPALELRNLGAGERGATPSEIGAEVLSALTQRTITAVGASELKQKLLDKLGPEAGGAAGRAIDQAVGSGAGQAVERGVNSLLGR
jgi:uncharacterized protein involved in outer membrane biogenesis